MTVRMTLFNAWLYLNVVSFGAIFVETLAGLILWYKKYRFEGHLSLSNEMNLG